MGKVNILVAVNVSAALNSGRDNIGEYVWMIDSNDYLGGNSTEGTDELITEVTNGDTIVWTVIPIDPNNEVSIHQFGGNAVPDMISPASYPQTNNSVWGGRVNKAGLKDQYYMHLLLEGNLVYFDPFITSTNI